jgi:hypothetical protein
MPRLHPETILLKAEPETAEPAAMPFDLTHLPGLDLRQAEDGWHAVWREGDVNHQFYLREMPPRDVADFSVSLPFDALFELRASAARRFWRVLRHRPPGREFRTMPQQLRQLHILTLRALDARLAGESYRTIAHHLLGFRGSKTDWENDPRKNKARRLVASGKHMMLGGYRALLYYPVKLRRR